MAEGRCIAQETFRVAVGSPRYSKHIPSEEVDMYLTDIVWWGYSIFVVALALFMLFFGYKVTKGEE